MLGSVCIETPGRTTFGAKMITERLCVLFIYCSVKKLPKMLRLGKEKKGGCQGLGVDKQDA